MREPSCPTSSSTRTQSIVSEDLTNKIVVWATEIASYAAQLPSRQARDDYLRERRRELVTGAQAEGATPRDAAIVADACVDAARRIMTELLALRAGVPRGALSGRNPIRPTWALVERNSSSRQATSALFKVEHRSAPNILKVAMHQLAAKAAELPKPKPKPPPPPRPPRPPAPPPGP